MEETDARPWAVIDLDGVVADVGHRLHHLSRRPKDWGAFFGAADKDPLLAEGHAVVARLAEDHEVVYLTGRPEYLRRTTSAWLQQHALPAGQLLMRRRGDFRPSRVAKVEALRRLAGQRPVGVVVDDDDEVVAAARAAGFTVLHADWAADSDEAALREAQERDGRT
jgi:hypothetical protein